MARDRLISKGAGQHPERGDTILQGAVINAIRHQPDGMFANVIRPSAIHMKPFSPDPAPQQFLIIQAPSCRAGLQKEIRRARGGPLDGLAFASLR